MSLCGALSSPICLCSQPVLTNNRDSTDCLMKSTCTGVAAFPKNIYLLSWQTAVAMFICVKGMVPALLPQLRMKGHLKSAAVVISQGSRQLDHCLPCSAGPMEHAPPTAPSVHSPTCASDHDHVCRKWDNEMAVTRALGI